MSEGPTSDAGLWAGLAALATAVLGGTALLVQKAANALTLRTAALREAAKADREHLRGEGGLIARVEYLEKEVRTLRRSFHDLRDWMATVKAREELAARKR